MRRLSLRRPSLQRLDCRAVPATFTVLNTANAGAGSLRQAVLEANAAAGADTIVFDAAQFASPQTIALTSGEIAVSGDLTITGIAGNVTVSGNTASRVFNVDGPGVISVSMSGLVLTAAKSTGSGGAIVTGDEILNLTDCTITGNTASNGAGIDGGGGGAKITLTRCVVTNNTATGDGGGLSGGGTVWTMIDSTVANNTATNNGGGLNNVNGTFTITGSTFSGNKANQGGGVRVSGGGAMVVRNSTLSGNSAADGGAFRLQNTGGSLVLENSTVTANSVTINGGGINRFGGTGTISVTSTVLSGNIDPDNSAPDVENNGTTFAYKNSAIGSANGITAKSDLGGNLAFGTNLKLGTLANNGGPTLTHLPADNSPLVNAGSNPAGLLDDQRGIARNLNGGVDIGSVEVRFALTVTNANDTGPGSLRQVILDANALAGADTVTFASFTPSTITLTSGEIPVTGQVAIQGLTNGDGSPRYTVSGNNASRVFDIDDFVASAMSVEISDLVLTAGKSADRGGAVFNQNETLSLTNVTVSNSFAPQGAGIHVEQAATLTVTDSLITGNTTDFGGRSGTAINMYTGGTLLVTGSAVTNNVTKTGAASIGGAVYFYAGGSVTIRNTTISGNTTDGSGGGLSLLAMTGAAVIEYSTIANNSAVTNGGAIATSGSGSPTITLESSVVSGNTAGANPDISTAFTVNMKSSAVGSGTGFTKTDLGGNLAFGTNLKLGPLQLNGGRLPTHRPANDSPLVNAGTNPAALEFDQRGVSRVVGIAADIGAAETAAAITVTNAKNGNPGSLRRAVTDSDRDGGSASTITFDAAVFASAQTITLTSNAIAIADSVTILGIAGQVTLSGNNESRIFKIDGPGSITVSLSGLVLTAAKSTLGGGAIVTADEILNLTDCTITGNTAANGGGIDDGGAGAKITLTRCVITNNTATNDGGGLSGGSTVWTIIDSTIANNTAAKNGGGLNNVFGTMTVTGSTFSGNKADQGGSVRVDNGGATLVVRNSTFSGNSAADGGAFRLQNTNGNLVLENSTVTANSVTINGGGINRFGGTGTISVTSTIISGNIDPDNSAPDVENNFTTFAYKNSGIGSASGITAKSDLGGNLAFGTNLKLGPLANNGGLTQTHLPATDSPLIDVGSNPAGLTNDQRGPGFPRARGGNTDIGAAEARTNFVVTKTADSGAGSLREAIIQANAAIGADTIVFDPTVFASAQTITLASPVSVSDAVTISGPGANLVTVSGNKSTQVLNLNMNSAGDPVTISGLTLANGQAVQAGGIGNINAALTLTRCVVSGHTATSGNGGAIIQYAAGASLTLDGCTVSGNSAKGSGGFLDGNPAIPVVIRNSTISGNSAGGKAGPSACSRQRPC